MTSRQRGINVDRRHNVMTLMRHCKMSCAGGIDMSLHIMKGAIIYSIWKLLKTSQAASEGPDQTSRMRKPIGAFYV